MHIHMFFNMQYIYLSYMYSRNIIYIYIKSAVRVNKCQDPHRLTALYHLCQGQNLGECMLQVF